jgi:hypothetical protein
MANIHHDPVNYDALHHDAIGHATADAEYAVTPPGAGHEHTDASVWLIAKFGLWLLVTAIVIHVGMGFMFAMFVEQREESEQLFPLASGQERRLPAAPRLQQFPVNEFYEFRQREDATLKNYGWIDRGAGRVQIPIDEAMRLVVERGLPVRAPQADAAPDAAVTSSLIPADSSSGRTMERRR